MATTGLLGSFLFRLPGAAVGALALSVGVTTEALASRVMVHSSIKALLQQDSPSSTAGRLNYKAITVFYYPLALTYILNLGIVPMVTFFMGQSRMPLESLAVLPVINSLVFIFRSLGLSFQEVGIALLGEKLEGYQKLRNFVIQLGCSVLFLFGLVNFTPLAFFWFHGVSGLSIELSRFALLPTKILTLAPPLMVLLSFQRAIMVNSRKTKQITIGTAIELLTVILLLVLTTQVFGMIGALGAAIAMAIARILAVGYMIFPTAGVLKKNRSLRP